MPKKYKNFGRGVLFKNEQIAHARQAIKPVVFNQRGISRFQGMREPLCALQHGMFD